MFQNPFRNMDQKKLRHSSDLMRRQNDFNKTTNERIKILAIVIAVLFSTLGVQVFRLQILSQEEYEEKLIEYTSPRQVFTPPRGQFYDRNNVPVVQTLASNNITYFPPEEATGEDVWQMAIKFAIAFEVDHSKLRTIDLQDMFIYLHRDENNKKDSAEYLLSEEESYTLNYGKTAQQRGEMLHTLRSRIDESMIDEMAEKEANRINTLEPEKNSLGLSNITADNIKSAWLCYSAMTKLPANEIKTVLEDVSSDQVAYLIEHKTEFKGFDIDFSAWKREYPYGSTLRDVFGNVTSNVQGIPAELQEYYMAIDYALNERIGSSGLEKQYEQLLSGTRKESEVKYDENGIAIFNEVVPGKKGYDLQLSIDIELQQKVDEVLKDVLQKASTKSNQKDFTKAFVILMNPKTGEIYTISGMQLLRYEEDGETVTDIIPYASGNYLETFVPGSIVKPATLFMGLNEGVVTENEIINDTPMHILGTAPKKSYHNYGPITGAQAIAKSSNVYMFHIAIRLGGATYIENGPLAISDIGGTFDLMRNYYSMFGLGNITGLDVPNETGAYVGYSNNAGNLLDFSIGQYDNYTPIQLAQYVSTIANNGVKVKPRLVKHGYEINSNTIVFQNKAEVVSVINGNLDYLKTVQEGMRGCVADESCGIRNVGADMAAKTGTAEVRVRREDGTYVDSTNASLIGYGPYDDPRVSFVCVTPTSSDAGQLQANPCVSEIMPPVLEEFFKKY